MTAVQILRTTLSTGALALALAASSTNAQTSNPPATLADTVDAALKTAPVRALTDPTTLVSPPRASGGVIPLADLYFLRSSWFGTWTPDGKSIIITTDLTGRTNLWKVPVDDGFPLQLQQSEDKTMYPAVSPDGETVIYASDIGGREIYDIFAIPMSGGAAVNLTHSDDASDTGPLVFSPNGKWVAFNRRVADHARNALIHRLEGIVV